MKKYIFTVFILIVFLSIHAQNTSTPARQNDVLASLTGEWKVTSATNSPLIIIPRCKPVGKGTIIKFTENELTVFTGTSGQPCGVYHFKITANTISIIKEDMIWLCAYEINKNTLKIKSDNFFLPYQPDKSLQVNKQPYLTPEIEITLIKQHN